MIAAGPFRSLVCAGSARRRPFPVARLRWLSTASNPPPSSSRDEDREDLDSKPSRATSLAAVPWQQMGELIRPQASLLAGGLVLGVATTGVSLVFPMAMGSVLDISLSADPTWTPQSASLALFGLFCGQSVLMIGRSQLLTIAGERLSCDLRTKTFANVARQDLTFFDQNNTGELLNRLAADTTLLQKTLTTQTAGGLGAVMMILGSGGCLVYTSPWLALLSFSVFPPVFAVATLVSRRMKGQQRAVQDALAEATDTAQRALTGIRTLRLFAAEGTEVQRYRSRAEESRDRAVAVGLTSASFNAAVHLAGNASMLTVLAAGGQQVLDGTMTLGALTSFLLYSLYLGINSSALSSLYADVLRAAGAAERVLELMERPLGTTMMTNGEAAVAGAAAAAAAAAAGKQQQQHHHEVDENDGGRPPHQGMVLPLEDVRGVVEFDRVTFAYPSRPDDPVLRDVSLTFAAGESVGIVGPSGCGKSTVLRLLSRLYDPCSGRILLDGHDIRTLDPDHLRAGLLGVVPQGGSLLSGTIAENVAMPGYASTFLSSSSSSSSSSSFSSSSSRARVPEGGEKDTMMQQHQQQQPQQQHHQRRQLADMPLGISRERIDEALARAGCTDFIRGLEAGADTQVGEQGVQLSGGQQQRVAIARLAARSPRIVLLDEMTSHLDSESEALVLASLGSILEGRTALAVAHRYSAIEWCDRVLVLGRGGEVVEDGAPAELLRAPDQGSYLHQMMWSDGSPGMAGDHGPRHVVVGGSGGIEQEDGEDGAENEEEEAAGRH